MASVEEIAAMGEWPVGDVEARAPARADVRPRSASPPAICRSALAAAPPHRPEGTPAEKIVTEHLRLLQNHQVPEIARKLGMSIEDLREHIEIIRNLDPKPGSRYNPTQSQHVIPDVYIVKVEDQYVAALNEEGCRSCASARSTAGCSTRAAASRATRRAPTSRTSSARRCG